MLRKDRDMISSDPKKISLDPVDIQEMLTKIMTLTNMTKYSKCFLGLLPIGRVEGVLNSERSFKYI
jgi:hypothetical protein